MFSRKPSEVSMSHFHSRSHRRPVSRRRSHAERCTRRVQPLAGSRSDPASNRSHCRCAGRALPSRAASIESDGHPGETAGRADGDLPPPDQRHHADAGTGARPLRSHPVLTGQIVSHRRWQTTATFGQGARGTCWAFAGIAALEAAYARIGVNVTCREQYLFHISKAHENHRAGGGIHSLIGFQGSSDIVHHLTHWAVPARRHVPYIDQRPLQALANSIPGTGGALAGARRRHARAGRLVRVRSAQHPADGPLVRAVRRQATSARRRNFTNDDIKAARWPPATTWSSTPSTRSTTAATCC